MNNELKLNKDGTRLLLNLSGELDAAALEDLVLLLGSTRERMEPPVPRSQQENGGAEIRCTTETMSGLQSDPWLKDGTQVLRLRSARFGWLGWSFLEPEARAVFELLAQRFKPDRHHITQPADPKH